MKLPSLIAFISLAACVQAGTEPAPTPPPVTTAPSSGDWWFRVAPYGWLTAIDGDVGVGPLSSPVDISMSDILDSVDMTYMAVIEAGYGRWSLGVDVTYAKLSQDIAGGGFLFDSFRIEQKQWMLTPILAYRAVETETYHMDVFAGTRTTILDVELTGRFAHGGEATAGRDTDWTDPIVGIRGQAALSEKFFFRYYGDIGGFGVSSDLTWQTFAGIGYKISDNIGVAAGYRALGIDYSKDGLSIDTLTHGPVIGLEVRF